MRIYRFLERRTTWALLLASLPLPPLIAISFAPVELEEPVKLVRQRAASPEATAHLGPDITAELLKLGEKHAQQLGSVSYELDQLLGPDQLGTAAAESFTTVAECLEREFAPLLTEVSEISQRGILRTAPVSSVPFRAQRALHKIGSTLAISKLGHGDWKGAIRFAEQTAHLSDAYRGTPAEESQAYLLRAQAYSIYETALRHNPDTSATRRLLDSLQSLAETEPAIADILISRYASLSASSDALGVPEFLVPVVQGQLFLPVALSNLAADLGGAGERQRVLSAWGIHSHIRSREIHAHRPIGFLPWTRSRAAMTELRRLAQAQTNALWEEFDHEFLFQGIDRDTAALITYGLMLYDSVELEESVQGLRTLRTHRVLLEAAFAARLYRADTDKWPGSAEELVGKYLPADRLKWLREPARGTATEAAALQVRHGGEPYGPSLMGMYQLTSEMVRRLIGLDSIWSAANLMETSSYFVQVSGGTRSDQPTTPGKSSLYFHLNVVSVNDTAASMFLLCQVLSELPGICLPRSDRFHQLMEARTDDANDSETTTAAVIAAASEIARVCGIPTPKVGTGESRRTAELIAEVPETAFAIWAQGPSGAGAFPSRDPWQAHAPVSADRRGAFGGLSQRALMVFPSNQ